MITVITTMQFEKPVPTETLVERIKNSAPLYRNIKGLVRKHFCIGPENRSILGVYLWESREAYEAKYTPEWIKQIAERQGAQPTFTVYETPCIVDNAVTNAIATLQRLDY